MAGLEYGPAGYPATGGELPLSRGNGALTQRDDASAALWARSRTGLAVNQGRPHVRLDQRAAEESKTMRRISGAVAVSTVVLSACGSEPTAAPARRVADPPPAALAAKAAASASPIIAIDDALSRVIAGLDVKTANSLIGPLTAVRAALKSRDGAALRGAIAVARGALAGPAAANDDRAPDLAAIALALDAAATGK